MGVRCHPSSGPLGVKLKPAAACDTSFGYIGVPCPGRSLVTPEHHNALPMRIHSISLLIFALGVAVAGQSRDTTNAIILDLLGADDIQGKKSGFLAGNKAPQHANLPAMLTWLAAGRSTTSEVSFSRSSPSRTRPWASRIHFSTICAREALESPHTLVWGPEMTSPGGNSIAPPRWRTDR